MRTREVCPIEAWNGTGECDEQFELSRIRYLRHMENWAESGYNRLRRGERLQYTFHYWSATI